MTGVQTCALPIFCFRVDEQSCPQRKALDCPKRIVEFEERRAKSQGVPPPRDLAALYAGVAACGDDPTGNGGGGGGGDGDRGGDGGRDRDGDGVTVTEFRDRVP